MFHGRHLIEKKFTGGWREIGMMLRAQSIARVNGQQVRKWKCRGVAVGAPPPWAGAGGWATPLFRRLSSCQALSRWPKAEIPLWSPTLAVVLELDPRFLPPEIRACSQVELSGWAGDWLLSEETWELSGWSPGRRETLMRWVRRFQCP